MIRFPKKSLSTTLALLCLIFCTRSDAVESERILLRVRQGGSYGFIDGKGHIIIPPRFYWAWHFQEGRALVYSCGKYGFIDEAGRLIIPAAFDSAGWFFSAGLARVRLAEKWGFIQRDGNMTIPVQFDNAGDFSSDGLAGVEVSGRWGYINKNGKFVIPPRYSSVGLFAEGLAPVQAANSGKWGYVDAMGNIRIPPRYDDASEFSERLAGVRLGSQWGYIDKKGQVVVRPKYPTGVGNFTEGLALVLGKNGKFGFIDKKGHMAISARFDFATSFSRGAAVVSFDGKVGFIDHGGKWVSPTQVGSFGFTSQGFVAITDEKDNRTGDEWGYMGRDGSYIWRAPVTEEPSHEMWPVLGLTEQQRKQEIEKSCELRISALPACVQSWPLDRCR